jgi:pantoate--beta-alanine ligase
MEFFPTIAQASPFLRSINRNTSIGSVHTLGALHEGHGRLIRIASEENEIVIVTVYPNKIQLFPGSIYNYSIEEDCELAARFGATHVIASSDQEMYPEEYRTLLDQGDAYRRLNSSVFPFATRGQVTGAVRWMILTQPTNSYYGMKDIEQALMVRRAAEDLFLPTNIRFVPCIRHRNGVPISSRLRRVSAEGRVELAAVYEALEKGRSAASMGERDVSTVVRLMAEHLHQNVRNFRVIYITVVDTESFAPLQTPLELPFILHIAVQNDDVTHFDGLCLWTVDDLESGPETIWLDD